VDIAPNLLEQARQSAATENLSAKFQEGDAEELPFKDGEFDVVISMFGAMFAPRPERAATELLRVCKSGGLMPWPTARRFHWQNISRNSKTRASPAWHSRPNSVGR